MARVALIKAFSGMNLPVSQLAAELVRAGHDALIIFLKRFEIRPTDQPHTLEMADQDQRLFIVNRAGVQQISWSVHTPFSDVEKASLLKVLSEFRPDGVGISCLSAGMTLAGHTAAFVRDALGVPVIFGGTGPTMEPARALESGDVVCVGEGEETIVEFADRLDGDGNLLSIVGTWAKTVDGQIVKNPKRSLCNLDDIAQPLWDPRYLVYINGDELIYNATPWVNSMPHQYVIMTQRGCPFSCSFCVESAYQEMFGKRNSLRRRDPAVVLEELHKAKQQLDLQGVMFFDDVFTINPRWHDEFLPRYKQEIGLPFWCYTYPGVHTRELLERLKDAGCRSMSMGVQSGSKRLLEVFNRKGTRDRVAKSAQEIVEVGIKGTLDLIPSTVFDTEDDLRETLDLLLEIPHELDASFYNEMVYFPNYPISRRKADEGIPDGASAVDRDTFYFYLKLYNLTRTSMPRDEVRRLARDPETRAHHSRLNPLLNDDPVLKKWLDAQ
jgi:radical SAM superfamily enzyme YgiQ (UPF0313 family)